MGVQTIRKTLPFKKILRKVVSFVTFPFLNFITDTGKNQVGIRDKNIIVR